MTVSLDEEDDRLRAVALQTAHSVLLARRRAEDALLTRTNDALAAGLMGVWELDLETQRMTWSETMAPLFRLTQEQAPWGVDDFLRLIRSEDRQAVADVLERVVREGTAFGVEFRVLCPDGETRWMLVQGRLLPDADSRSGGAGDRWKRRSRCGQDRRRGDRHHRSQKG